MAEWRFEKKPRTQKSRDPMQDKFFTNDSISDDAHALVREAIQNSLDARADNTQPVKARIYLGLHAAEGKVMHRYVSDSAWEHFNAKDSGLIDPPSREDECRFLVYEDFNTSGLSGDEQASEPDGDNAFCYFMRAEGRSGKHDGARGRHGIGKIVFPKVSRIRTFLAVTVRSPDQACLIAGQSLLKEHHVGGETFTPDGWWGAFDEEDGFQLPVVDDVHLFEEIKTDFSLNRNVGEPGLSLVMPYIRYIEHDIMVGHVLSEFLWPIIQGQLVVEVGSHENPQPTLLDHSTIVKVVDEIQDAKLKDELRPLVELAVAALNGNKLAVVDDLALPKKPERPDMSKLITKEKAKQIQGLLDRPNTVLRIKVPLYVQRKNGDAETAFFHVYLTRDKQDSKRSTVYVREGISIPNDRWRGEIQGLISLIAIEKGALATFLGDSENPAHTEWEKNASGLKGKYKWAPATIEFVIQSARRILDALSRDEEEKDRAVLSDIFYLNLPENDDDVPPTRKKKLKPQPGPDTEPLPKIPPSRPKHYSLSKIGGGFVLQGAEAASGAVHAYTVTVAYDFEGSSKTRALKKYHKSDFDLEKGRDVEKPICDNIENLEVRGNVMVFTAPSNNFRLEVKGFDQHRDIIVDVISREAKDEAL
jgi:hypothetical protein